MSIAATDIAKYFPCRNPNCKTAQKGLGHVNCRCYGSHANNYAHGGEIQERYCHGPHKPECEHYADGGPIGTNLSDVQPASVSPKPFPLVQDNPKQTLGHIAVNEGLLGILKNVGKPKMLDPDKHEHVLREAKAQHAWRSNPGAMALPKSHGNRLGEHLVNGDHDRAAAHMHGHPLVGQAQMKHLKPIMERLSQAAMTEDPNPEAFRGSVDYLHGAVQGENHLSEAMDNLLGAKLKKVEKPDSSGLKAHLDALRTDPQSMLDIGGSLGHYLPEHSAELAAQSAQAVNYLESLRPKPIQNAPFDRVSSVSKAQEANYERQLGIAQKPLIALQHLSNGSLQPQDVTTIQTVYPGLYQDMLVKLGERLVDSKTKGTSISYHQRQAIGLFMGQPIDSTMAPVAMQTIMKANAAASPQQKQQAANKKASGVELKEIDKVNSLYQTPAQARQSRRD